MAPIKTSRSDIAVSSVPAGLSGRRFGGLGGGVSLRLRALLRLRLRLVLLGLLAADRSGAQAFLREEVGHAIARRRAHLQPMLRALGVERHALREIGRAHV